MLSFKAMESINAIQNRADDGSHRQASSQIPADPNGQVPHVKAGLPKIIDFNSGKKLLKRLALKDSSKVIIQLKGGTNSLFSMFEALTLAKEIKKKTQVSIVYRLDDYLLKDFNQEHGCTLNIKELNDLMQNGNRAIKEKVLKLMQAKDPSDPNFKGVTKFLSEAKESSIEILPLLQNAANSEIESIRAIKPPGESPMPDYSHLIEMAHSQSIANRSINGMWKGLEKRGIISPKILVVMKHDSPFAKSKASKVEKILEGISSVKPRLLATRPDLRRLSSRKKLKPKTKSKFDQYTDIDALTKNAAKKAVNGLVPFLRRLKYKLSS